MAEISTTESVTPKLLGLNRMDLNKECHLVYLRYLLSVNLINVFFNRYISIAHNEIFAFTRNLNKETLCRNASLTKILGIPCDGDVKIDIPSVHTHMVLYTSPIVQMIYENFEHRHAAILGEMDKFGLISKARIERIETYPSITDSVLKIELDEESSFEFKIHIWGQQDESVELSWMDSFNSSMNNEKRNHHIFKHECMIGRNNTAIFTIKFPFDTDSFAECH